MWITLSKTFTQSIFFEKIKIKYVYLLPLCTGVMGFKAGEIDTRDKLPWGEAAESMLIVLLIRGTQTYWGNIKEKKISVNCRSFMFFKVLHIS